MFNKLPIKKLEAGKGSICKECINKINDKCKIKNPDLFRHGNDEISFTVCDFYKK